MPTTSKVRVVPSTVPSNVPVTGTPFETAKGVTRTSTGAAWSAGGATGQRPESSSSFSPSPGRPSSASPWRESLRSPTVVRRLYSSMAATSAPTSRATASAFSNGSAEASKPGTAVAVGAPSSVPSRSAPEASRGSGPWTVAEVSGPSSRA